LNKLRIAGRVWIASDVHLGPDAPGTRRAFYQFLDKACAQADALILCGDIFDAWIGDDFALQSPPEWLEQSLQKLREVSAAIPLWLGPGNRDFLISATLAGHVGAQLLPDRVRLETDGGPLLLSHGDEYCTADPGYQRFRRLVRNPFVQRLFLSLNLGIRARIAEWARSRSMTANRRKAANIMDVSPDAIERAFSDSGLNLLVHGHTHRPAIHRLKIHGKPCTRIVLPDWDYDSAGAQRGGWLAVDSKGPVLHWTAIA
jgi:UDP-2,3-diacylglucosamine hydrolase